MGLQPKWEGDEGFNRLIEGPGQAICQAGRLEAIPSSRYTG